MKWEKKKLKSICELSYGKNLTAASRIEGDFPVYGSAGKVGTHTTFLINGPGIIIGRKGSIGKVYYEKENFFPIDTVYYITKSDDYEVRFLYYVLQTLGLEKLNSDAAVPGLNRNVAYEQEISLPPLPTQRRIASILSSYDDLIENNLRRIKLLEEAARCEYKMLMEEGEFIMKKAVDVLNFTTGKLNSNAAIINGTYPFFTCGQEVLKTNTFSFDTEAVLLGGNNASAIYPVFYFNGKFDAYQRTYIIKPKIGINLSHLFLFHVWQDKLEYLKNISTGAATKFLTLRILNEIEIPVLNKIANMEFDKNVRPLYELRATLDSQNTQLRQARDLLLPKLMSGEIDVEEVSGTTYIEDESFQGSMAAEDEVAYSKQTNMYNY